MLISKAIRKYGPENFTFEVIKTLRKGSTQDQLNRAECRTIKKYNSMYPIGYNLKEGGSHGAHLESTKLKISVMQTGVPQSEEQKERQRQRYNIPGMREKHSRATKEAMQRPEVKEKQIQNTRLAMQRPEVKAAASKARKGVPQTEERRAKMKAIKSTPEARAKNSASHMGQIPWNKGIKTGSWSAAQRLAYEAKWESKNE